MKFALDKAHRDFFQKEGWIEFEDCVSQQQIARLNRAIDQALQQRLQSSGEISKQSPTTLFLNGRDLWRLHSAIRKFDTQSDLAAIASGLIEKQPLRLGYTQLFIVPKYDIHAETDAYTTFIQQKSTLQAVSCLREVACGLILNLGTHHRYECATQSECSTVDFFSQPSGRALFFHPTLPINWDNLYQPNVGNRFYLIVYVPYYAQYYIQPDDPHTHALKHLGYGIHDNLNDKWNPVVFR